MAEPKDGPVSLRSAAARRALSVAAGLAADRALPEPPDTLHPVAVFGRAMTSLEGHCWKDDRAIGAAFAALGVAGASAAGARIGSTILATALCVASHSLGKAAELVAEALAANDLIRARGSLRALVGRDVAHLDRGEVARAAIESVAENTVDAVVAPALWAFVGGARFVFAYRAVNTLDAMIGYRDSRYARFGWAAARADDVANWVPARLTAILVAASRPGRATTVWRTVRRDAPGHPSPNSGVAEAAFAAALGLRLGGLAIYRGRSDPRPYLGDGRDPAPEDISGAVRLSREVTAYLGAALLASALVLRPGAPKPRSDVGRR